MRLWTFAEWQRWQDDYVQQTETDKKEKNGRWWIAALKSSSSYRLELSRRALLGKVKDGDKQVMMLNDDMMDAGGTGSRDVRASGQKHIHKGPR